MKTCTISVSVSDSIDQFTIEGFREMGINTKGLTGLMMRAIKRLSNEVLFETIYSMIPTWDESYTQLTLTVVYTPRY